LPAHARRNGVRERRHARPRQQPGGQRQRAPAVPGGTPLTHNQRSFSDPGKRGARDAVKGAAEACALCFPAGTLVATPQGMHAIDTLHVGDQVLSENPATGKVDAEAVQAVIRDI